LIAREEVMFVASRRLIQGAIRVKVHRRRPRRSFAHATYSPLFLHPSHARGRMPAREAVRARARPCARVRIRTRGSSLTIDERREKKA